MFTWAAYTCFTGLCFHFSEPDCFYNLTESPSISSRLINIKHSCEAEGNGITCAKIVEPVSQMLMCPVLKPTHRHQVQVWAQGSLIPVWTCVLLPFLTYKKTCLTCKWSVRSYLLVYCNCMSKMAPVGRYCIKVGCNVSVSVSKKKNIYNSRN